MDAEEQLDVDNVEGGRTVSFPDHPLVLGSDDSDQDDDRGKKNITELDNTSTTTNNQPQSKTSDRDAAKTNTSNFEMIAEVNNQFSCPDEALNIGGSTAVRLLYHEWRLG